MCAEHAEQAQEIITERLERAPASNRQGWDAIVGGSSMLDEPTFGLPLWLLTDLGRASDRDRSGPPSEAELRSDAELALELAKRLAGRPEAFAELMVADVLSDVWLIELPMALAAAGLVDEAVAVGDALAELDQDNSAMFASDVAVILAEAGRRKQALARVEAEPAALPRRSVDADPRRRRSPRVVRPGARRASVPRRAHLGARTRRRVRASRTPTSG